MPPRKSLDLPQSMTRRKNSDGTFRYYWQPSKAQRRDGWALIRLPDSYAEAVATAEAQNARVAENRARAHDAANAAKGGRKKGEPPLDPRIRLALAGVPGTVKHAIERLKKDEDHQALAPKTLKFYDFVYAILEEWGGALKLRHITKADMRRLVKDLAEHRGSRTANAARERMSRLFRIANDEGEMQGNPAALVKPIDIVPSGIPWPREADPLFVAAADALGYHSIGTAIVLNAWLGQREADLLELPRALYKDGRILVAQSKTNAVASLPVGIVPALAERIEKELAKQKERGVVAGPGARLLLRETTGGPWDEHAFRHAFADVRAKVAEKHPAPFALDFIPKRMVAEVKLAERTDFTAAPTDLIFKDLRHTAILRLHEAGVTLDAIGAVTGHTSPKTALEHYMAVSEAVTRTAFAKRRDHEAGAKG